MDAGMLDDTVAALEAMVVGDALGDLPAVVQAAVLVLTLAAAVWARRGSRLRVVTLVACCLMWSRANHAFEGAVLHSFSHDHGLTVADLLPPALAGSVALARRRPRGASSAPDDGAASAVVATLVPRPRARHEATPASSRMTDLASH